MAAKIIQIFHRTTFFRFFNQPGASRIKEIVSSMGCIKAKEIHREIA